MEVFPMRGPRRTRANAGPSTRPGAPGLAQDDGKFDCLGRQRESLGLCDPTHSVAAATEWMGHGGLCWVEREGLGFMLSPVSKSRPGAPHFVLG